MKLSIFLNRRSGIDRRNASRSKGSHNRIEDRRANGGNNYILVVGGAGLDRFNLTITLPSMLLTLGVLIASAMINF
jgi:hypothetical protein